MEFFKFPRTPHLFVLPGASIRDDKVMSESEANAFLSQAVIVEEKVDGANVGISFDRKGDLQFQNRGNYISPGGHPQFEPLWEWAYKRFEKLKKHLTERYILFGEWCYLKHSIQYTQLPDWFLGFDIYDRHSKYFLSVEKRNHYLMNCEIEPVPLVFKGHTTTSTLIAIMNKPSMLYPGPLEGLYLRLETGGHLNQRAKLVRSEFIQSIEEHWSKGRLVKNKCISFLHGTERM
ncbi:MAG: RNA ligase family protein [Saprospiraceae bacterium]|nr:RNA ligase family protein [Saprospiraceae bacterium]